MKRQLLRIGLAIFILLLPVSIQAVKIVSWNILDFYGPDSSDRVEDFRKVLDELQPDVLVVQDMENLKGVNLFLNQVLNHNKKLYKKAKFTDQIDTASALFYNKKTIRLISSKEISTLNRSVWGYFLKIRKGEGKGKKFWVHSVHLPKGTNAAANTVREFDASIIRDSLNNKHVHADFFLVCGTFNFGSTNEAAFKTLTEEGSISNGRLFDPLDILGKWHRKKKIAVVHTESTRKVKSGVGAFGGLDDRYDNFFISQGLAESEKLTYIPGTYIAFGNDGKHFKNAVTTPANKVVSQDMAEALYRASDHLPIIIEIGLSVGDLPWPPTQLMAEALSSAKVKLTWKDNSDNEDGYHLGRAGDCFSCHTSSHCGACHLGSVSIPNSPMHEFTGHTFSWSQITTLNSNAQSYTDDGLSAGTTYIYRVRAFNDKGPSDYSDQVSITTKSAATSLTNLEK